MENINSNTQINGSGKSETLASFAGKKAILVATLTLLLSAILSMSGCTGLTGAPKVTSGHDTTSAAATISVAPGSISFGSVALGSTASQSVTISNGGGSSLTVTQASTTAAGVTITGVSLPLTIAAGSQATFNVVFSPKAAGALSGNVSVMSDAGSTPSTVSLSGIGTAASATLTTSASSLSFGNVTVGGSSVLGVTLTNAGNSNVTVSAVNVSGATFTMSGVSAGMILAPGQSATLDARFSPLAAGNLAGSVTVVSNATNSPATISLAGNGTQTGSNSVQLSWTASTSTVAGYNVYRSEVSGGPYSKLDSSVVATDSYTDSTVQAGLTYYYVVTSVSTAGVESANSAQVTAIVPAS
jgi:hypothetical protein